MVPHGADLTTLAHWIAALARSSAPSWRARAQCRWHGSCS